jgi:hypothetical protein
MAMKPETRNQNKDKTMNKETKYSMVEAVEKMGLEFNSMKNMQGLCLVTLMIAKAIDEEEGTEIAIETKERIVELLEELKAVNYSALRQKVNVEVFGKKADPAEKARESAKAYLR